MADSTVNEKRRVRSCRVAFFSVLTLLFAFRLWFSTTLPLSGDESYHWEWSRHLAFGYYDHPGLTGYLIRLCTGLFGRSTELSVRFGALLMLSGTAVVCYALGRAFARDTGEPRVVAEASGMLSGMLILCVPVFAFMSVYIGTDPPLVFFWSLSLYLFYRAFRDGAWALWVAAGLSMGLAMMTKFLSFFLAPALLLFLVIHAPARLWLRRPQGYVSAVCALLVFSPFLWWNATHGWATFMFNFVYRQKDWGFAPGYFAELLLAQALALSPVLFVLALAETWHLLRKGIKEKCAPALLLGLSTAVPLGYFAFASMGRRVALHWPMSAWLGVVVCLACRMVKWLRSERAAKRRTAAAAIGVAVGITALAHVGIHIPPRALDFEWKYAADPKRINIKLQSERFGWPELGASVASLREEMLAAQEDARGVFVICREYGMCSNVSFYTPGQIPTHLWARRRTHGENYRFWDNFGALAGQDAIYVTNSQRRAERALHELREHFERVAAPQSLPIIVDGREVRAFYLVRCYAFDGVTPSFARKARPGS